MNEFRTEYTEVNSDNREFCDGHDCFDDFTLGNLTLDNKSFSGKRKSKEKRVTMNSGCVYSKVESEEIGK